METFQILSDQFSHFQHLFHRWLAIFCIISSYIFDLSSSPHTWGIRGRILSIVFLPVHPHLCWAYPSLHLAAISQNGSSPHTWGIHGILCERLPDSRFIPTYVGHTRCAKRRWPGGPVHPHIRGAYVDMMHQISRHGGSSPHTWGIRPTPSKAPAALRFIPTYVGHTFSSPSTAISWPVHPHIRGAYSTGRMFSASAHGSSPHTWGIRRICPFAASRLRFIPTYVGHTFCVPFPQIWKTVHPHIRGAYFQGAVGQLHALGSSPHTWGIPLDLTRQQFSGRFIPTYVGHTAADENFCKDGTVHPHIRGAYFLIRSGCQDNTGSSPHTWGIPLSV